jgi:hypothetical protein
VLIRLEGQGPVLGHLCLSLGDKLLLVLLLGLGRLRLTGKAGEGLKPAQGSHDD